MSRPHLSDPQLNALLDAHDAATSRSQRDQVLAEVSDLTLRRAFADETVLFPALRRHLPGAAADVAAEVAAHADGPHQQAVDLVRRLQTADPRSPGRDDAARRALAAVREDARAVDDDLLPRLRRAAGEEELGAVGARWDAARDAAPVRPRSPARRTGGAVPALTVVAGLVGGAAGVLATALAARGVAGLLRR